MTGIQPAPTSASTSDPDPEKGLASTSTPPTNNNNNDNDSNPWPDLSVSEIDAATTSPAPPARTPLLPTFAKLKPPSKFLSLRKKRDHHPNPSQQEPWTPATLGVNTYITSATGTGTAASSEDGLLETRGGGGVRVETSIARRSMDLEAGDGVDGENGYRVNAGPSSSAAS